jgi:type IV secretion system protein VirB11
MTGEVVIPISQAAKSNLEHVDDRKRDGLLNHELRDIQPFLDDPRWTEVAINKPRELWTEGSEGWVVHPMPALSLDACMRLGTLIATYNGKKRVQVVIPPACKDGTVSITIRRPSMVDKTLEQLEKEGAFRSVEQVSEELHDFEHELLMLKEQNRIREFLELAVKKKRTINVVGKTGSGKTTIAKTLAGLIPAEERLITIEDVHEMFLNSHRNKVHLLYRRSDEEGIRPMAKSALASCLRMKPDRILLAELRGDEAWEFVKSVNTGHPGSLTTMHANGAYESFEQMTALIKDSATGSHLDAGYIKQRLFATIDIVLFYRNRKLVELYYDPHGKRKYLG